MKALGIFFCLFCQTHLLRQEGKGCTPAIGGPFCFDFKTKGEQGEQE
jgi:hypothetical protein